MNKKIDTLKNQFSLLQKQYAFNVLQNIILFALLEAKDLLKKKSVEKTDDEVFTHVDDIVLDFLFLMQELRDKTFSENINIGFGDVILKKEEKKFEIIIDNDSYLSIDEDTLKISIDGTQGSVTLEYEKEISVEMLDAFGNKLQGVVQTIENRQQNLSHKTALLSRFLHEKVGLATTENIDPKTNLQSWFYMGACKEDWMDGEKKCFSFKFHTKSGFIHTTEQVRDIINLLVGLREEIAEILPGEKSVICDVRSGNHEENHFVLYLQDQEKKFEILPFRFL